MLIALDGVENSGKSTQAHIISKHIPSSKVIKEPFYYYEQLLNAKSEPEEYFILMADRIRLYRELKINFDSEYYILDRCLASTYAYQLPYINLSFEEFLYLNNKFNIPYPDILIILDIDPAISFMREKKNDKFHSKPILYHESIRARFTKLKNLISDVHIVDANDTIENITKNILTILKQYGVKINGTCRHI